MPDGRDARTQEAAPCMWGGVEFIARGCTCVSTRHVGSHPAHGERQPHIGGWRHPIGGGKHPQGGPGRAKKRADRWSATRATGSPPPPGCNIESASNDDVTSRKKSRNGSAALLRALVALYVTSRGRRGARPPPEAVGSFFRTPRNEKFVLGIKCVHVGHAFLVVQAFAT